VLLPFDRNRLAKRNALDDAQRRSAAAHVSPREGILEVIELSEVVRKLALATGAGQHSVDDLAEKARLYVAPLRAARPK
jgi:hypothetical protein